jgi:uncharacterized membrane protein
MRTMLSALFGLSLVALLSGPAAAQGGRGFGMFGGNLGFLLSNESVQKELKLDDKQLEKAKELAEKVGEEMREKREGLQDLSPEERRAKMMEINREVTASTLKAAGEFLKPEQIGRLKQISLQQRNAQAFLDPEVAKKLNLKDSQKTEFQTMVTEAGAEMRTIFQENQDDREAAMKKIQELNKKTLEQIVAKLNDEQQKAWKEMLGSPFEVKYEAN